VCATDIILFHDLGISLLPFSRFFLFPLLPGLEKDTDVVFKESFNNFLDRYYCDSSFPPLFILPLTRCTRNRFKKAPKKAAKNNKIGAVSSPSKVSAPLERVASVSKDSLFERAPSGASAIR
jgi:hypothetical protein